MDNNADLESSTSKKGTNPDQPSLKFVKKRAGEAMSDDQSHPGALDHRTKDLEHPLHDVTGDVKTELKDSRLLALAGEIISTIQQPYVILDRELRLRLGNSAFHANFSVDEKDARNEVLFRLANGQWDLPPVRSMLERVLKQREPVDNIQVEYVSPQAQRCTVRMTARPFPVDADRLDLVLLAIEIVNVDSTSQAFDVTGERPSELGMQTPQKDEFLALLSHELRNPMAPIASALELLGLQPNESKTQQHARAIIERQVRQLKRVIDDLQEVSRMSRGAIQIEKVRCPLREIVDNAIEDVRPLLEQFGHQFEISIQPQSIWLEADPARLEQVLANLLSNAAKFTNPGGRVSLTVSATGDQCEIHVADTGVGIDPELIPRIFESFTTGNRLHDRTNGGLGIGLSLAKRLVELHGGRINVISTPGQGSDFGFFLPLSASPQHRMVVRGKETKGRVDSSLKVMIVDDNEDGAQTLGMLLLQLGYEALTVHDGPTSIEAALDYRPDVIILDIGLPGLNGYEVAKKLRQQPEFEKVLIVAMTGYGDDNDRQRSIESGINHHLIKPSDFEKLQRILDEFVK
ncbi:ATP-binding protein [Schlesneria sp.]|uniref:hybrid sensor histidine kinase/response regulator n=1 Tax=Schlesneria sp. TaxID=2762018 RepID=UPI002F0EAD7E